MFHKTPLFFICLSFLFSGFLHSSFHPTDYKLFEEFAAIDPNIKKGYVWFGNEGEIFIYFDGTIMQIDTWHIPDH